MKRGLSEESRQILKNKAIQCISKALYVNSVKFFKSNRYIQCACPIHNGDNPTALAIDYKLNSKHAGSWFCNTRGCHHPRNSIFTFYQLLFKLKWPQVYSFLEDFTKNVDYLEVVEEGDEWEELSIPRDQVRRSLKIPSEYYLQRGFSEEVLDRFDVGDCFDFTKPMYNRAIIPVYRDSLMIGCSGRAIGDRKPKWRHSRGFRKTQVVYNLSCHNDKVVIVESPGNVLRLNEAGINAVGIFGAKMSASQEKLIKSLEKDIVVITDNDGAGYRGRQDICERFRDHNVINLFPTGNDVGDMSVEQIQKEFRCIL